MEASTPLFDATEEEIRLAIAAIAGQAEDARTDVKAFFSLVMRHEHTGQPVLCAPHQRVLFDFVEAHPMCVIRMPVGTAKTTSMAALTLHLLGRDPTSRGAIVSATQAQAMKPLAMVRDHIETSDALRLVFPGLRRSRRKTDGWTITEITVDRPPGIRDPSLVAVGIDGALAGARLSWCVVDDILNRENTSTAAGLQKVNDWFGSTVLTRIDPDIGRVVVTNTPWNPSDITYRLENPPKLDDEPPIETVAGWPTLTMDVLGNITITNAPDFDTADIVPSVRPGEVYRLASHGEPVDEFGEVVEEVVPLWPDRYSWERIERLRADHLPYHFNQSYLCIVRDEATARCKIEWVEQCKDQGRGLTLTSAPTSSNGAVFTGVDLAVGKNAVHDATAFFTFEQLPDGKRRILDIEVGQWDGPTIVEKIIGKAQRYGSIVRVETNAAQEYILQFARARNAAIPIRGHMTGRQKAHPEFGIEGLFIELRNGAWVIPCSSLGVCHPAVQRFIDACLYYQPHEHTDDVLLAAWLAREQARELNLIAGRAPMSGGVSGLATDLMTR